jgi:hypothetical protein
MLNELKDLVLLLKWRRGEMRARMLVSEAPRSAFRQRNGSESSVADFRTSPTRRHWSNSRSHGDGAALRPRNGKPNKIMVFRDDNSGARDCIIPDRDIALIAKSDVINVYGFISFCPKPRRKPRRDMHIADK